MLTSQVIPIMDDEWLNHVEPLGGRCHINLVHYYHCLFLQFCVGKLSDLWAYEIGAQTTSGIIIFKNLGYVYVLLP